MRTIRSATMILVATAIAAAGVRDGGRVHAAGDDPCSLLTAQDAAAALGEKVGAPKAMPSHAMGPGATSSGCVYTGAGSHDITLHVIRMSAQTAAIYKSMCAQKSHEGLSGLGDMACWYNADHHELQILKGLTFFSIELRGSGNPTEPIRAAAKRVLDRL